MTMFDDLLSRLSVLDLDRQAADHAARFRVLRERSGFAWKESDNFIAGIVFGQHATLATRNLRDFAKLPIDLVNPWDHQATLN